MMGSSHTKPSIGEIISIHMTLDDPNNVKSCLFLAESIHLNLGKLLSVGSKHVLISYEKDIIQPPEYSEFLGPRHAITAVAKIKEYLLKINRKLEIQISPISGFITGSPIHPEPSIHSTLSQLRSMFVARPQLCIHLGQHHLPQLPESIQRVVFVYPFRKEY